MVDCLLDIGFERFDKILKTVCEISAQPDEWLDEFEQRYG